MNPSDFTTVSYKFTLYDAAGEPVEDQGFEMQYLKESTQEWTLFHTGHVLDGEFLFEEEINPVSDVPKSIFLQDGHIPELRFVANPYVYSVVKPEVLAFNCELITDEVAGTLMFDFGTSYIVERDELVTTLFSGFQIIATPFQSVNQSANLELIEDLETAVAAKDAEIADLTATVATQTATISTLTATVATQTATIATRDATITSLNAEIDEKDEEIADLTATVATLTATVASQAATIATRDATITSLNAEIDAKDEEIAELTATVATLTATIAAQTTTIAVRDTTIASLNAQLIAALSDVEEQTLNVTRLENIKAELEETIVDKEEQIVLLQEQLDIDAGPVRVSTLYQQLVDEIGTSAKGSSTSGYKLANISLKLKTLISRDEEGVNAQLFDLSAMNQVNGDAVSELVFDIAPTGNAIIQSSSVPNVLGLTETAVRRVLSSVDLRLNPVFQNNTQVVNGDSFKQTPEAGTIFNTNDIVTVIFSKHE